ncbi:NAD(+) synthase [Pasteurellaceae bacterium TAE3-ERU1]|nr:NAD(+) synthase [Pasteurellaceae bacterium TAE3-ERU1]
MTALDYCRYLSDWLESQRKSLYQLDGYVLGLSGGIDSAVCLYLAAQTGAPVHVYMLPTGVNNPQDLTHAQLILDDLKLKGEVISIQPMYDAVWDNIQSAVNPNPERKNVLYGNLMARLRMVTLYTLAQSHRAVVIGTDNLAESYTGYFTKFGDGAADVLPLARLRKEQVYELVRALGVPQPIIDKAPSAGLWEGQTDEGELGFSYAELDAFLRGEAVSAEVEARIAYWHNRSRHKRMLPPTPERALED